MKYRDKYPEIYPYSLSWLAADPGREEKPREPWSYIPLPPTEEQLAASAADDLLLEEHLTRNWR